MVHSATTEKRAAAQKAEADFFALLKESGLAKPGAVWKDVGLRLCASIFTDLRRRHLPTLTYPV